MSIYVVYSIRFATKDINKHLTGNTICMFVILPLTFGTSNYSYHALQLKKLKLSDFSQYLSFIGMTTAMYHSLDTCLDRSCLIHWIGSCSSYKKVNFPRVCFKRSLEEIFHFGTALQNVAFMGPSDTFLYDKCRN